MIQFVENNCTNWTSHFYKLDCTNWFSTNLFHTILLSDVEQEQRPSGNGDREATVVRAGLCDVEGERAFTIYDPLGRKKYQKGFKRFETFYRSKNLAKTKQFDLKIVVLISISLFDRTKIRYEKPFLSKPSRVT